MGSQQSSATRLPQIARQHWHEVPLPSALRRKASHGQFKLFSNALTNQKIEQYRIIFQTKEQYAQYVQCFAWREREESIVNTRYFQNVKEDTFCGSRIYSKVYLEHTPFRLNSVNDIPIGENLYVLSAALTGFEKLFAIVGYFRTSEDLVGIDTEGRVKVWFNHNFSKGYHFGNGGRQETANANDEERMVRETIVMVEKKTSYTPQMVRLMAFLQEKKVKLTFSNTKREIVNYAKRFNLNIPNYFLSLLQVLGYNSNQLSDEDENRSNSISPFIASHSLINESNASPIRQIQPEFYSHQNIRQVVCSQLELKSLTRLEQEYIDMPREGDTTGETIVKNSFRNSKISPGKLKKAKSSISAKELPKIRFNYLSKNTFASPLPPTPNTTTLLHQNIQTPEFHLPLSQIAENSLLQSFGLTRRLTYSDINEDYQLDEQLAEDLVKYFNN